MDWICIKSGNVITKNWGYNPVEIQGLFVVLQKKCKNLTLKYYILGWFLFLDFQILTQIGTFVALKTWIQKIAETPFF